MYYIYQNLSTITFHLPEIVSKSAAHPNVYYIEMWKLMQVNMHSSGNLL